MRQTLILTGDIHLGHVVDPAEPFALVRDVLGEADVVFGNLEGCLYDPSVTVDYKPGWHHVGPEPAPALMHGGFHALGCANNVNFGAEAIMATVARLDEMGIAHTGAGADRAAARAPAIVERGGVRFGFLQYTSVFWPLGHEAADGSPGVAAILAHTAYRPNPRIAEMPGGPPIVVTWPDAEYLDAFRRDVAALRERVDFLVASFHWGISGSVETADYQVAIAHAAIDSGADLVMGHGPHEIQAVEITAARADLLLPGQLLLRRGAAISSAWPPSWSSRTATPSRCAASRYAPTRAARPGYAPSSTSRKRESRWRRCLAASTRPSRSATAKRWSGAGASPAGSRPTRSRSASARAARTARRWTAARRGCPRSAPSRTPREPSPASGSPAAPASHDGHCA